MRPPEVGRASAYDRLVAHQRQLYDLDHLQSLATWDRMTFMPPAAAQARGRAQAALAAVMQGLRDDPAIAERFEQARAEPLDDDQRRNLELMLHERRRTQAVPARLVERLVVLRQEAGAAWSSARARNDWDAFVTPFAALLAAVRERAARLGDALGVAPYDALLDEHEPGLRHARVTELFSELAGSLPALVEAAVERQRDEVVVEPEGPFAEAAQRAVCERVMAALGFDFDRGRLDVSGHPFTGGVPEDVRLTTRFAASRCLPSLLATMHETGHACYQQHLPREWLGQPIAGPQSAALHEGQALTFERQLAPTAAFAAFLSPLLDDAFGHQPAFAPDNLVRALTRVKPGRIRVEADELTYPLHVLLRVDLEAALIDGRLEAADIPAAWDEGMHRLLGIDTRGDFAAGPLQDVHWSQGLFGYFPAYVLGAMVAAQCMEALRRDVVDLDDRVRRGDVACVGEWLAERIWREGARHDTDVLLQRATGQPLGAAALERHLRRRYALADAAAAADGAPA